MQVIRILYVGKRFEQGFSCAGMTGSKALISNALLVRLSERYKYQR